MMIRAVILLFMFSSAWAAEAPTLQAKADYVEWWPANDAHATAPSKIDCTLYLTNCGTSAIRIPCRTNKSSLDFAPPDMTVVCELALPKIQGMKIKVPEASLEIVELLPGETAMLHPELPIHQVGDLRLKIQYTVDPDIAAQFGLWHGSVETYPHKSKR